MDTSNEVMHSEKDYGQRDVVRPHWWLTSAGTETELLVLVKVICRGTPAVPIGAALCGAPIVCLAQEHEGENTLRSIAVPADCVKDYGKKREGGNCLTSSTGSDATADHNSSYILVGRQ